jgi:hypothetical protein
MLILLQIAVVRAEAQFSFSPSTLLVKNQALNMLSYDSIHISNLTADTLHMNWSLILNDSVNGTHLDFCASGSCFLNIPLSGSFPAIMPFGFGWAGAHFWTGSIPATSIVKIWVYQAGHTSNGDTLTYILHGGHDSGIENNTTDKDELRIYPNPASNLLYINSSENQTITAIYDANGRQVSIKPNSSHSIDISSLDKGFYFVYLLTDKGIVVRKFVKE